MRELSLGQPLGLSDPERLRWCVDALKKVEEASRDAHALGQPIKAIAGLEAKNTQTALEELLASLAGYQPLDSDLTAIAALTTTTYGRALLTLADGAALIALLLTGASNDDIIQRKAGAWTNRTLAQLRADIPASDTATGVIELAVQSEMETGTDVARAVTPGRQQFHPSACKCWGINDQSTGITGYNFSSITDAAVGIHDWNINVDMSSAAYAVVTQTIATPLGTAASSLFSAVNNSLAAGSFRHTVGNMSTFLATDPGFFVAAAFGDQ